MSFMKDFLRIIVPILVVLSVFALLLFIASYATLRPPKNFGQCVSHCGNGICEEIVCLAAGCPCIETQAICPQDCRNMKIF